MDFKEFGKVMAKQKLAQDLLSNRILVNKDLDVPFSFPKDPAFEERIAVVVG